MVPSLDIALVADLFFFLNGTIRCKKKRQAHRVTDQARQQALDLHAAKKQKKTVTED